MIQTEPESFISSHNTETKFPNRGHVPARLINLRSSERCTFMTTTRNNSIDEGQERPKINVQWQKSQWRLLPEWIGLGVWQRGREGACWGGWKCSVSWWGGGDWVGKNLLRYHLGFVRFVEKMKKFLIERILSVKRSALGTEGWLKQTVVLAPRACSKKHGLQYKTRAGRLIRKPRDVPAEHRSGREPAA